MKTVKGKCRKAHRGLSGKWILVISTSLGVVAGACFWFFLLRCGEQDCILNYFPLPEMFAGGMLGLFIPMIQRHNKF
ncbi:hypothetical protein [Parabacteroides gordonii]|uniref:hypothetical protein n=1 Tax=Parabacteroides gordonii TaxID=574930 RepID=UPI0026F2530E|nr:hypothetical protein [Parabacteroides gordonii]